LKQISINGEVWHGPVWSSDGQFIAQYVNNTNSQTSDYYELLSPDGKIRKMMPVDKTGYFPIFDFLPRSHDQIVQASYFQGVGSKIYRLNLSGGQYSQTSTTETITSISCAPVGSLVAYTTREGGLYILDLNTWQSKLLISGKGYDSVHWSKYSASRRLIGTGGMLDTSTGSLIYGQGTGNRVNGMVSVDATTRSTIQITPQANANPTQPYVVCTVSADNLTSLKYANGINAPVTSLIGSNNISSPPALAIPKSASSAILSFSADTGAVASVILLKGNAAQVKARTNEFVGNILGVWNSDGKNLAPNGASRVTLNALTGSVESAR
jgi:hypothetical protein